MKFTAEESVNYVRIDVHVYVDVLDLANINY